MENAEYDSSRPLAEQVAQKIKDYILEEKLKAGDKLPTETALAKEMGVARCTVREAIKRLESQNILTVRHGAGSFVTDQPGLADDPLGLDFIEDKERLAFDLLEVRNIIEPAIAALAAHHATPEQIAEMEQLYDQMEYHILHGQDYLEEDMKFHRAIAQASGNLVAPQLTPIITASVEVFTEGTHRTRIYTSKDEKTARKAFLGQGILLFGWSFVTAIIGMSCFTIATMNGDTLASGDYAFAYMATNALPPVVGMLFMICGLSATMSSGDSDAISGVTILLTDVYPSITGKTIKEEDYAKFSRVALICTLGAAFFITLFVNDVIGYISTIVGAFLPGVAVAMLLGRFWKRVNWQGGLACIGSGTLLGVLILVLPSFKNWINATMGGPAVPATIVSLVFGIVVSLMFSADTTPEDVRLKHVMNDRRGTVVEKVAAAEAAADAEEDL